MLIIRLALALVTLLLLHSSGIAEDFSAPPIPLAAIPVSVKIVFLGGIIIPIRGFGIELVLGPLGLDSSE